MGNMNHYARDARECKEPVGAFAGLTKWALKMGPVSEMRKYYPNRSSIFK
jgi:hypothetical protein